MSSALPLKVTPASTPAKTVQPERSPNSTPTPPAKQPSDSRLAPTEISSPHELTAFVEALLEQLDTKFDNMSTQILDRMTQMSTRVDALEASIQDIINGDITTGTSVPPSPGPQATPKPGGLF